ncbi:MAG: AMP-binding protein [Alphaproteobacteria bacterium]
MNANLYAIFHAGFSADPSAVFLRDHHGKTLSFAGLKEMTGRFAALLLSSGVRPGDRVACQVENSPQNIGLYLAALQVGAIFLPMNPAYTEPEVRFFLDDAEPAVFVTSAAKAAGLGALAGASAPRHIFTLEADGSGSLADQAARLVPLDEIAERASGDVAAILYTSGTTGRSKGAMLTHGNLASNVRTLHAAWGFRPDDTLLHALPLFHIHGLFVATNLMLLNRGKMILLPKFDPALVIQHLPDATLFMGVPTYYTRLLAHPQFGAERCKTIRLFVSGSAPLLSETFAAFADRTGHAILERYGMTETGMNCSNPLDGERRPGTVGPALPGVEVRICDKHGRALPRGEIGVIEVRGPNVFSGYWRLPEKTAEEIRGDGFFITGDLGTMSDDGYVTIIGRDKDMIISGGLNVYPKEIEDALNDLPGVVESAVFGVPHADFGEAVMAVVVAAPGMTVDEKAARDALSARLARFKIPKRILAVAELPRNTMGKVQKSALRERYKDGLGSGR